MNCNDFNKQLDDYLDKSLQGQALNEFIQHTDGCKECALRLQNAQSLMSGLRDLPLAGPSDGFEQRVFAAVREHYQERQTDTGFLRFASGFATAAIAGLAIWFVVAQYPVESVSGLQPVQTEMISVAMNQSHTVRLLFDAEKDFEQVQITLELPRHMDLDGYPGIKQLSWQTRLDKGGNILALPLKAVGEGQGELIAQVNYGDKHKVFKVLVKTPVNGVLLNRKGSVNPV